MNNFKFANPVKIIFGKNTIQELSKEIPTESKVMLIYGGGSILKNGVYDQVAAALKNFRWIEFAGIEANPHYETCVKAIEKIRENKVDFLLAAGGGSVVDAVKFIAAGAAIHQDPWDIMTGKAAISKALPFGTVITLPATGSEMNSNFVITKNETKEKLAAGSFHIFPKFSILDPETTYSLSPIQTANGIVDAFVHVIEQYLTCINNAPLQDYFAESIMKVLIEGSKKVFEHPTDYEVRANLMWASSWALNGWIAQGVLEDWSTHMIGHELTAFFGIAHAQTLAIVLPGVMEVMKDNKKDKILQLGNRVFGICEGNQEVRGHNTILAVENLFNGIGIKTHLSDYGVDEKGISLIVNRMKERNWNLGEMENINYKIIEKILKLRL